MRILVDLDGVIFKTYEVIGKKYKKEFGKDLDWSKINDGDKKFWKTKYGKFLLKCFKDARINVSLPIYKDADKVLRAFAKKKGNRIIYCTARRRENWGATAKAFEKFNLPIAPIVFLTRENVPEDKARVAKAFDCDIAIDDEDVNLKALNEVCSIILQFGCYKYEHVIYANLKYENVVCHSIIGVKTWKDIKKYIL